MLEIMRYHQCVLSDLHSCLKNNQQAARSERSSKTRLYRYSLLLRVLEDSVKIDTGVLSRYNGPQVWSKERQRCTRSEGECISKVFIIAKY